MKDEAQRRRLLASAVGEPTLKVWQEAFLVALDALRANKVRASLTALGVVIGSACIVLVVTVGLTGRKFVLAQIEGVGSNLVWAEYVEMPQQARAFSYEQIGRAHV